jgi:hypothetical protein
MTLIRIDPDELQRAADLLRRAGGEAADLGQSLGSACCCEMPASVGSYVDAELGSVGASVGDAATGYGSAADDAALRAESIAADQSLVASMNAAYGTEISAASGGGSLPLTVSIIGGPSAGLGIGDGTTTVSTIGGESGGLGLPVGGPMTVSTIGGESGLLGLPVGGPMTVSTIGGPLTGLGPSTMATPSLDRLDAMVRNPGPVTGGGGYTGSITPSTFYPQRPANDGGGQYVGTWNGAQWFENYHLILGG